ncbi:hypothetical protein [Tahibacter amnicola]|uniref:Uncharacterized protein n=1 Tax=Tahibacter amnicola TaxID=2976241 RepID=A0ABY6BE98_9GAMM|nr:hypothetical protein [Tahibacter amnicola]UXI67921.1 hypothetical protein N4264_24865 [Tahibacter amnicola]
MKKPERSDRRGRNPNQVRSSGVDGKEKARRDKAGKEQPVNTGKPGQGYAPDL